MIGVKHDEGKLRWSLLPWSSLEKVVRVLMMGAKKYSGANSWQKLTNPNERYLDALVRHVVAYMMGNKIDPESGESHMAHVIANALFLLWFEDKQKIDEKAELKESVVPDPELDIEFNGPEPGPTEKYYKQLKERLCRQRISGKFDSGLEPGPRERLI